MGAMATLTRIRTAHLNDCEHRVENHEDHQKVMRDNDGTGASETLLALVFARPIDVVARRQLDLLA